MLALCVSNKTLFVKWDEIFPECKFQISDEVQLHPLICLVSSCHRNYNCMPKLAHRVKYIFDTFKDAKLLVLYFRYRDRPDSQRAGLFFRDMREPRYITMNPYAWEKFKNIGEVYEFDLPDSLFLNPEKKGLTVIS